MTINLGKWLKFVLINVAIFYGIKWYYDTRDSRIVMSLSPSIVKVSPMGVNPFGEFGVLGHGTGTFIRKDGLVLTCAHVVEGTTLAELTLIGDKKDTKVLAYVVGRDVEHDIALLRVHKPLKGIRVVKLGTLPKRGTSVLSIGFPGPFVHYTTLGVISGHRNDSTYTDAVLAPGNSGGPIFDRDSRLVGIAQGMTGYIPLPVYQGFSVIVPIDSIKKLVEKYREF